MAAAFRNILRMKRDLLKFTIRSTKRRAGVDYIKNISPALRQYYGLENSDCRFRGWLLLASTSGLQVCVQAKRP
jgi:hypothetical protein